MVIPLLVSSSHQEPLLIQFYLIVHSILLFKQLFEIETSPPSIASTPAITNKRKTYQRLETLKLNPVIVLRLE